MVQREDHLGVLLHEHGAAGCISGGVDQIWYVGLLGQIERRIADEMLLQACSLERPSSSNLRSIL